MAQARNPNECVDYNENCPSWAAVGGCPADSNHKIMNYFSV